MRRAASAEPAKSYLSLDRQDSSATRLAPCNAAPASSVVSRAKPRPAIALARTAGIAPDGRHRQTALAPRVSPNCKSEPQERMRPLPEFLRGSRC